MRNSGWLIFWAVLFLAGLAWGTARLVPSRADAPPGDEQTVAESAANAAPASATEEPMTSSEPSSKSSGGSACGLGIWQELDEAPAADAAPGDAAPVGKYGARPALDAAAPAEFATATFSLG